MTVTTRRTLMVGGALSFGFMMASAAQAQGNGVWVVTSSEAAMPPSPTNKAGRSITLQRVPDYWGKDLPINAGQNNFDTIRYDYYRDDTVALEAFKAGEIDVRQPFCPVRFAGETVAMVVAESLAQALDAAERVAVDYEPLPAVTTAYEAVEADAPLLSADVPGNVCMDWRPGDRAATEAAWLIDEAFDHVGVHRVCIRAGVRNLRSRAIPERLGFVQEGVLRGERHLRRQQGLG